MLTKKPWCSVGNDLPGLTSLGFGNEPGFHPENDLPGFGKEPPINKKPTNTGFRAISLLESPQKAKKWRPSHVPAAPTGAASTATRTSFSAARTKSARPKFSTASLSAFQRLSCATCSGDGDGEDLPEMEKLKNWIENPDDPILKGNQKTKLKGDGRFYGSLNMWTFGEIDGPGKWKKPTIF